MSNSKSQANILMEIKAAATLSGVSAWNKFVADLQQGTEKKSNNRFQPLVMAFFSHWWDKTGKAFNKSKFKCFPDSLDGKQMQNQMLDKLFADATAQSKHGRWKGLDGLLEKHAGFEERLERTRFIGSHKQSGPVDPKSLRERAAKYLCKRNES